MLRYFVSAASVALIASPFLVRAETFVDDFEGGTNDAGWTFIAGADVLESTGGNPGWWLHQPQYDTFAPTLESSFGNPTPFAGDFRSMMVSGISLDARTDALDFGNGEGFSMTLLLRDTNGTPANFDDDDFAYAVGPNVPLVGEGWVHYDFAVPATANDLPPGWKGGWVGDCESFRPGVGWIDVVSSVDRVEFWWIDPCFFAIFQVWNVGADNVAINFGGATPVEATSWGRIKLAFGDDAR